MSLASRLLNWKAGAHPNVALLVVDQLTIRALRCYGAANNVARTPNIDRLAAEGLVIERAYATYPACAPTRGSILTGLYPAQHGQIANNATLPPQPCVGDWFAAEGYATASFGKLHTHGVEESGHYGFDELLSRKTAGYSRQPLGAYRDDLLWSEMEAMTGQPMRCREQPITDDEVMVNKALEWVANQEAGQPWFLHLSILRPHYPFHLPAEWYDRWDPSDVNLGALLDGDRYDDPAWSWLRGLLNLDQMTEDHWRLFIAKYLAAVEYADHLLGLALDGLPPDTLVMFIGDHGEHMGERGLLFKMSLFEESIRHPAIVRWPGMIEPGRYEGLLSSVDVAPTLYGLATGLEAEAVGLDLSIPLLLNDPSAGRQRAYVSSWYLHPQAPKPTMEAVVCLDGTKLVECQATGITTATVLGYDLAVDPDELYPYRPTDLTPLDQARQEGL